MQTVTCKPSGNLSYGQAEIHCIILVTFYGFENISKQNNKDGDLRGLNVLKKMHLSQERVHHSHKICFKHI